LMLSLEKKKIWFHWFKTIKILGTKTKLSKSSIDLNEKWENLGKVVTARNVRGRGRRLWETCAVGDGIKGRQVGARALQRKIMIIDSVGFFALINSVRRCDI
jgi:hypothetical protein